MRKQIYNKIIPNHFIPQIDTGPNAWTSSTKGGGWSNILKSSDVSTNDSTIMTENNLDSLSKIEHGTTTMYEEPKAEQQWLNLKTGEMTEIHPHSSEANELKIKESQRCRIILKERVEHLEMYNLRLSKTLEEHQNAIATRILMLQY